MALCGFSARKLHRGSANLLAGRALILSMESFSPAELGHVFDLNFALNWGVLPAGLEVHFIIEAALRRPQGPPRVVAIEVKRAEGLAAGVEVDHMIGVYCAPRSYLFGDVQVFPVKDFISALFSGDVF